MSNNAMNVTQAMPKVTGAVSAAPAGTTLPTDATTALPATFKSLGYISDSGLTNSVSIESASQKAWGGDVVLASETGRTDTFKLQFLETMNADVLKAVYGDSNVSGTLETGLTVKANGLDKTEKVYVFDMILRGGYVKRIVVPQGMITAMGDVVYKDSEATVYDLTITGTPDTDGQTHYEYTAKPAGGD